MLGNKIGEKTNLIIGELGIHDGVVKDLPSDSDVVKKLKGDN